MGGDNALVHGASASAPWIATDADNGAGLANAHAVSVAAFAAAADSVAASARSDNSSNSSESDLDIIGEGHTASGRKSTRLPKISDQQPLEDYFSADGDDVDDNMDDNMPTDAEVSKYSFRDRLEHYMKRVIITEDNCKAVELAIMVEASTTVREMEPMKKEIKEKAFLNSYVSIIEESLTSVLTMLVLDQQCSLPIKALGRKYWREARCGGSTRMS
jgi:hypothetical protein